MVTKSGYQRGALKYAQRHGILLYELFDEPVPGPITAVEGSFATFELNPTDHTFKYVYFETKIENINITLDQKWVRNHETSLETFLMNVERFPLGPQVASQFKIYDEHLKEQTNVLKVFHSVAEHIFSGHDGGERYHTHKFKRPTCE
jgi:hypothetical protein